MTDAPLQPVLAYGAPDTVPLLHPRIAIAGFLLLGFWFLNIVSIVGMRLYPASVIFPFFRVLTTLEEFLLIGGSLMIIRAFRGSPLAPPRMRLAMFLAVSLHTVIFGMISLGIARLLASFYSRSPVLYAVFVFLETATIILFFFLLLILLQRAGRSINAIGFRLFAILAIGVEMLLLLLSAVISQLFLFDLIDKFPAGADLYFFTMGIGRFVTGGLMFALCVWCAIITSPLSRPAAVPFANLPSNPMPPLPGTPNHG